MKTGARIHRRASLMAALIIVLTIASSRLRADTGTCGNATTTVPFNDVGSSIFFCQIAEAYFSGLTNGTSATTYSPHDPVPREQMAAFITRTQDSALRRGSRRAALNRWWLGGLPLRFSAGPGSLRLAACDGADIWVANAGVNAVSRFRASDLKYLGSWTNATAAAGVLPLNGIVYVTGFTNPGSLYQIIPSDPPGGATLLANTLGANPSGIAFDGKKVWTANNSGSVSIVDALVDDVQTVQTVSLGFNSLGGILFDGSNIWVTDFGANTLLKLDSNGNILQGGTVPVGAQPFFPIFDGTNIWVPNHLGNSVTVVRASTGAVVATLTGNGLSAPTSAAFDGERILVTNQGNNSVSLWKAADLTPLGNLSTNGSSMATPFGSCSDGIRFFVTADPSVQEGIIVF